VRAQLRAAAATLSTGTQPGDALLTQALNAAAGQPAGASRIAVAQEALALAQVLHANHEIMGTDYQNAVSALEATGASPAAVPLTPSPSSTDSGTRPTGSTGSTGGTGSTGETGSTGPGSGRHGHGANGVTAFQN
jgi:hypothetical protein